MLKLSVFLGPCCPAIYHHVFHEVTHLDWNLKRLPSFFPRRFCFVLVLQPFEGTLNSNQHMQQQGVSSAVCMKYMATYNWEDSSHQFTVFDSLESFLSRKRRANKHVLELIAKPSMHRVFTYDPGNIVQYDSIPFSKNLHRVASFPKPFRYLPLFGIVTSAVKKTRKCSLVWHI